MSVNSPCPSLGHGLASLRGLPDDFDLSMMAYRLIEAFGSIAGAVKALECDDALNWSGDEVAGVWGLDPTDPRLGDLYLDLLMALRRSGSPNETPCHCGNPLNCSNSDV